MSKQRKTRQEKKISDLRNTRQVNTPHVYYQTPKTLFRPTVSSNLPKTTTLYDTSHVIFDLLKTFILTASIMGGEIVLFTLLRNNVVSLLFISYK